VRLDTTYTDTLFSKVKSLRDKKKSAQVWTNDKGYDHFHPLGTVGLASDSLVYFIHSNGIPQTMISDNAKEETQGD
jgi:hypothetical protein